MLLLENLAAAAVAIFILATASYIVAKIIFFAMDCIWAVFAFMFMILVHPVSIVIEVAILTWWYFS